MTRQFAVKKEIRSLGLDISRHDSIIGAVVRGGLYLDGIVIFRPKPRQWSMSIARQIIGSRFYPELKLVMTNDPERKLDIGKIEMTTRLPIIEIRVMAQGKRLKGFRQVNVATKTLHVRSSLEPSIVNEVLEKTWTIGALPEPLRVAHLIVKSRFLGKNRIFWANK